MKLITNAADAWKFLSVQIAIALGVFDTLHTLLPAVQQYVPATWVAGINTAGAALIVLARILKQEGLIQDVTLPPDPPPSKGT